MAGPASRTSPRAPGSPWAPSPTCSTAPTGSAPRTRARVEQAMADLGFVRNESARQLRAGRSRTLAYVVLDATNPFFTDVAQGIEEAADGRATCRCSCATATTAPDRERDYLSRLEQQRVARHPAHPGRPRVPAPRRSSPAAARPLVIVDRTRAGDTHCSVAVDDVLGGRLAVEHLLDQRPRADRLRRRPDADRPGARPPRRAPGGARGRRARRRADLVRIDTAALSVGEGRQAGERLAGLPGAPPPDRGVLRQRPARPRPAPAVRDHRGLACPTTSRSSATTTSSSPARPPCR